MVITHGSRDQDDFGEPQKALQDLAEALNFAEPARGTESTLQPQAGLVSSTKGQPGFKNPFGATLRKHFSLSP